jgi:hypothetical protein
MNLSSNPANDTIFGEWQFDFPNITENFDENCREDIVWNIQPPNGSENCVWAVIHQICLEGIVEIYWETPETWNGKSLSFGFRGEDTGSGYHLSAGGSIIFTSTHECTGVFHSEWDDPGEFVGKKVSNESSEFDNRECRLLYEKEYDHPKEYWSWH